jgi:hypothetical protein
MDNRLAADAWRMGRRLGGSGVGVIVGALMPRLALNLAGRRGGSPPMIDVKAKRPVAGSDCDSVIAEFIRTRGITRCPTACVLPTQGSVDEADRAALEEHATLQERSRRAKAVARARFFWSAATLPGAPR